MLGYDDALDVFGIHCIGGIIGAIGTGLVVNPGLGRRGRRRLRRLLGSGAVLATCPVAAYDMVTQVDLRRPRACSSRSSGRASAACVIWIVLRVLGLLRVSKEIEDEGLDITEHGEVAYHP